MRREVDHEFELLCNCARTRLSTHNVETIRDLISKGVRWDSLIQLAEYHRVRPLLYKSLWEGFESYIPSLQSELLEKLNRSSSAQSLFLVREFGRLLNILSENGIPAIAFKGPILAHVSYGGINLRTFVDMDVLVKRGDFYTTKDLLISEGYLPDNAVANLSPLQEKVYLWQDNQYPVARGPGVFKVDLHTEIMPPLYTFNTDFSEFWERSEQVEIEGFRFNTFHPEDRLVILCFHGIKNRWNHLRHVCDVAETINSMPTLDLDSLALRAINLGGERVFLLGLYLAQQLLDVALPTSIDIKMNLRANIPAIAEKLLYRLRHLMTVREMGFIHRSVLQLSMQDTLSAKTRYISMAILRRLGDLVLSYP